MDADYCVSCGEVIPEGRMVCGVCEHHTVRVIVLNCPGVIARDPSMFETITETMQSLGEAFQRIGNSLRSATDYLSNIISPISFIIKKREPDIHLRISSFIRAKTLKYKPLYAVAKAVFRPG